MGQSSDQSMLDAKSCKGVFELICGMTFEFFLLYNKFAERSPVPVRANSFMPSFNRWYLTQLDIMFVTNLAGRALCQ